MARNHLPIRLGFDLEHLENREVPAALAALDPSFGTAGIVSATGDPFSGVALQADGKIVAVGTSNSNFSVARYNPDGTLDTTFNGTGIKTIDFGGSEEARAVAIQPDGKIVVVGSTSISGNVAVARLTTTGQLDTSFNNTGVLSVNIGGTGGIGNAVTIEPSDGKIVIAGTNGVDFAVIRITTTGTLDSTFGTGGDKIIDVGGAADSANAIAIQSNGDIIAAGTNGTDFALVRLTSTGSLDTTFDSTGKETIDMGGSDVARGLAIQSDGQIVVAGSNGADIAVARLDGSNGALDTTFNGTGKQTVDIAGADDGRAVQLQKDGKILVVGDTGPAAGGGDVAVVRLTTAGALDTTFNGTGKVTFDVTGVSNLDLGTAAVLSPDGRLVIASQGGGGQVNGALIRIPVVIDSPRRLAIGGSLDGTATLYEPDISTGQYNPVAAATIAAFGTTTVNVRVAIGDVNGDGVDDTILVTGPGTPIRVAVVSGTDNSTLLVSPFDPFGGNFTGGGFVTAADFNNDGRAEVVVTPDQGGGPRVTIFELGTDSSFNALANFYGINDPDFRGGARTAAGDINADGIADLAVAAGFEGGPRVAIYNGATLFTTQTELVSDFYAFDPSLRNGVYITIADMNGDGYDDVIFGAGPGGSPRVLGVSGKALTDSGAVAALDSPVINFFVAGDETDRGGVRLATANVDGDNRADLIVGTGEGQASFARVYFGKTFSSPSEPSGFQDLNPYSGAVLADGIYVG